MESLFSKHLPIFHSVHIDGKEQTSRFNSLHIQQSLNSCCDFELVETIATRKTLWQGQSQELLKQVGKNVIIRLSFPRGENTFQFSGFITEVVIDSDTPTQGGSENKIRIIGKGSPVVLDDAPSMNSFVDYDLVNIVEKVFKNKYFDLICNPKFKAIIPYAMQYKESRWEFFNRLSAIYNELLYFDGSKLVFGGVTDEHSENLTIDEDITEFKVSSRTIPFKYTFYNYNAEDDEYIYSDTEEEVRPRNAYTQNVFQDPENLYSERGMLSAQVPTPLAGDTARLQQSKYQQSLGKMHYIEGKTHNSLVRLGSLIYVKFPSGFEKEHMGEYRVISVEHCVDRDDYYNRFVAVPLGMEYPLYEPRTIAYPEIAEVVANDDPKKQGRVQVRFFWQKMLAEQTPWVRVQTPDAGVLENKSGNRGFQFIPEVGDQVMVSFEQGNPHRPYVSGSMYHGKNTQQVSHNVRSITTNSGSTITFDDEKGSVLIKDKRGSSYLLDGKGNIELNAVKDFTLCAGQNISLNAQNNFVLDVGNTALMNILQKTLLTTPFMEQLIATYFHTQAGSALIHSPNQIKIEAQDTNVAGTKKLFIHSDEEATVNSKGLLSVKGEQANNITNKAEDFPAEEIVLDANALLVFRPTKKWTENPTFGFDWYREGKDSIGIGRTDLETDISFKEIAGYYEDNDNSKAFHKEASIAESLKGEYLKARGKEDETPYEYLVPKLTIYKHEREEVEASAILDVFYQIYGSRNSLGDFILEYEEAFFEITGEVVEESEGVTLTGQGSIKPMNTPKMRYEPPHRYTTFKIDPNIGQMRIKITCKKTFDDLRGKQIRAYTLTEGEKADSPIKKCAGVLQVMPNSQRDRKVLKLLLVNVMTNTDGGNDAEYGYDATKLCEEKENLRMFLRQALIDPIFKEDVLDLSGTGEYPNIEARDEFNRLYVLTNNLLFAYDDSGRTGKENIAIYLHKKLQALNRQALEGGYLPVFFVPQAKLKSISSDGTEDSPAGYCLVDKQLIIMSKGAILGSLAHEVFHSLKLPHTWAHKDHIQANIKDLTAPNGKYSFEYLKTHNIMDYNRLKYHIYYWQAIIANKNALAEPNDYKPEQL